MFDVVYNTNTHTTHTAGDDGCIGDLHSFHFHFFSFISIPFHGLIPPIPSTHPPKSIDVFAAGPPEIATEVPIRYRYVDISVDQG